MSYKLQFLIDEVLQCLVDKYQITYQIIIIIIIILGGGEAWSDSIQWNQAIVRLCGHWKVRQSDTSFFTKKNIFSNCGYMKKNFKNNEAYQNF